MSRTVCTANNGTDILRRYKNKNISKSHVPFVPCVPRFCTIYIPPEYIDHDIYEYRLTLSLIYNLIIYYISPSTSSMNNGSRYNLSGLWCVKTRYRRYRWYKVPVDNFISVPLENSKKNPTVHAVQNELCQGMYS
jgi:hypothetical protein